ncbi:MAG: hypothetical protein ACOYKN_06745, partial [Pirellula sp.]
MGDDLSHPPVHDHRFAMSVDHNIVRFQIAVDHRFVVKRKLNGIARGDQVPEHRPNLIDKITLR